MTVQHRVVAYADSLSLARPAEGKDEALYWEQTWPWVLEFLLRSGGHSVEVINCGRRMRTVESFTGDEFNEHIGWLLPNIVIIQLGVVDCAPRIFSRRAKRVMNLPGFPARLRESLIKWRSHRRAEIVRADPLRAVEVRPEVFSAASATS